VPSKLDRVVAAHLQNVAWPGLRLAKAEGGTIVLAPIDAGPATKLAVGEADGVEPVHPAAMAVALAVLTEETDDAALAGWAAGQGPVEAEVLGTARLVSEGGDWTVLVLGGEPLEQLRASLAASLPVNVDFPAHITLAHLEADAPDPAMPDTVPSSIAIAGIAIANGEVVQLGTAEADADVTTPGEVEENLGKAVAHATAGPAEYAVLKAQDELRFTLGVMYAPDVADAHGEWVEALELQLAVWDYAVKSDRRLRLQHDTDVEAGTVVELFTLPWSLTVKLANPGREPAETELTLPAGTVLMGVVWDEEYWSEVKNGNLGGYSMGGSAVRVRDAVEALPKMSEVTGGTAVPAAV
jgi:hypothetical protein